MKDVHAELSALAKRIEEDADRFALAAVNARRYAALVRGSMSKMDGAKAGELLAFIKRECPEFFPS